MKSKSPASRTDPGNRPTDPGAGQPDNREEPPPFLGKWWRLYAIILVNLVVLILLFTVLTKWFE